MPDQVVTLYLHNVSNLPAGAVARRTHHHTAKTPVWVPPRETKLMAGKRLELTSSQLVKYRANFATYIEEGLCELRTGYGKKVSLEEVSEEGTYLDAPRPKPEPRAPEIQEEEPEELVVPAEYPYEPPAVQPRTVEAEPPAVPAEELPAPVAFESAFEEASEEASDEVEEAAESEDDSEDADDAEEVSDVGEAAPVAPRGAPVQSKVGRKRGRRNR